MMAVKAITQIFNDVFKTGYFPSEWKIAKAITSPKQSKPESQVLYSSINFLAVLSKLFQKNFIKKLTSL